MERNLFGVGLFMMNKYYGGGKEILYAVWQGNEDTRMNGVLFSDDTCQSGSMASLYLPHPIVVA